MEPTRITCVKPTHMPFPFTDDGIHPTYPTEYKRTLRVSKTKRTTTKSMQDMGDDAWKKKGHAHASLADRPPAVCPHCMGAGEIVMNHFGTPEVVVCYLCKGEGVIHG